jgi:hypothetical protein
MAHQVYEFWVHGVDVNIEYPSRVIGDAQRAGFGTVWEQNEGTDNWVHFAIPTPTEWFGDKNDWFTAGAQTSEIRCERVFLQGGANENAAIDRVSLWDGDRLVDTNQGIEGLENRQRFERPFVAEGDNDINHGLCISVHIQCFGDEPKPKVRMIAAGAEFHLGDV